MTSLDGAIIAGRHRMQIRVYYEDTDYSGIVYHANYLRFMERGRTNHLRLMGAEQHALFAQAQAETPGFAFVVRSMTLDFLKPARMDDVLDVVTWPVAVKGAEPGDSLVAEILDVRPIEWGVATLIPGFGQLIERVQAPLTRLSGLITFGRPMPG